MKTKSELLKVQIRLAHTYRHLRTQNLKKNLFLWILLGPLIIIYLFTYSRISYFMAYFSRYILSGVTPISKMSLVSSEFLPFFGGVTYLSLPSAVHQLELTLISLLVSIIILWISLSGRRKGHPVSIFIAMGALIQIVSCLFFVFASHVFPYSSTIYSELYVKQQISLWLFFLIIIGFVSALLGNGRFFYNVAFLLGVMVYSFIYGVFRYITYLYVVSSISAVYMAALFFTFGPLFDFLYITYFFGHYVNKFILDNERKRSEEVWQW